MIQIKALRDVWLVGGNPADVYGSDVVCEANESAVATVEAFAVSVQFGNGVAFWTCATCVSWVHKSNGNSREFCFVFDEVAELMETPRVLNATLGLLNRYPRAYARQVFEGYSTFGVFSLRNQPLGNHMVHVFGEARLFSGTFLQKTFCRLGSFALKFCSEFRIAFSHSVNLISTPCLPVGIHSDVSNTKVYSKPFFSIIDWRFRNIHNHTQIEYVVSDNEVGLPSDSVKPFSLVGAELHRNDFSALQCRYGYCGG